MKRENFAALILAAAGGIPFALGMCMCLVAQWGAFRQGLAAGIAGLLVLLAIPAVRRRIQGKPPVRWNARTLWTAALGLAGALALGAGMCMAMVWQGLLVPGIAVGVVGIVLLLSLIPVCRGLQ